MGSFVFGPRDVPYTFIVSSEQARFLLVTEPAGFEGFVRALGTPVATPELPPATTAPPDMEPIRVPRRNTDSTTPPRPARRSSSARPASRPDAKGKEHRQAVRRGGELDLLGHADLRRRSPQGSN